MLISRLECEIWLNFSSWGVRSVIRCIDLTCVPTTVVVAVVVGRFIVGKFWFSPPPRNSWLVSTLVITDLYTAFTLEAILLFDEA